MVPTSQVQVKITVVFFLLATPIRPNDGLWARNIWPVELTHPSSTPSGPYCGKTLLNTVFRDFETPKRTRPEVPFPWQNSI